MAFCCEPASFIALLPLLLSAGHNATSCGLLAGREHDVLLAPCLAQCLLKIMQ